MPWSVQPVSEIRLTFVHQLVTLKRSVAEACREFGISRKTGYKWLNRYRATPTEALADRSRRPRLGGHWHLRTVRKGGAVDFAEQILPFWSTPSQNRRCCSATRGAGGERRMRNVAILSWRCHPPMNV
jgi:hypothetical protein